jgi:hypothetical protein
MSPKYHSALFVSFCLVLVATVSIRAQQTHYRVGVSFASSIVSNQERFQFRLGRAGDDVVTIDSANRRVYFTAKFTKGQAYSITQISGPRACNLYGQQTGTVTNADVLISANCGTPPLTLFKFSITGIAQGENFTFADSHGRTFYRSFDATTNAGGYPKGDTYSLTQTAGPRSCRMIQATGIVPDTPVTMTADCAPSNAPTTTTPVTTTTVNSSWELVTRSTDNKPLDTYYNPVIGGKGGDEGRYVAFGSYAKEIGGDGQYRQIVWRDRKTGTSKIISHSPSGERGNQNSQMAAISADGKTVVFESYATNLVAGDANGRRDVFLWRADTDTVERVSMGQGGVETDYESYEPTVNGDGSLVAFTSNATNIIPNIQGQSSNNVYLKDMRSGAVQIISLDEKTKKGGGGSNASISEDGSRIVFYNWSPLTKEDTDTLWDLYLWERGNPKLKRVSKTAEGASRDQGDESSSRVVTPSISGNGRFVAYSTTATNVVGGDTNKLQDVFVAELDTGRVVRASVTAEGQEGNGDSPVGQGEKLTISYDGQWVAFATKATNLGGMVLVKNVQTGKVISVFNETGSTFGQPVMSAGGNYVLFFTYKHLDSNFKNAGLFVKRVGVN